MGLDMYLTKKHYVRKNNRDKLKIEGIEGVNTQKVIRIEEEIGYWRKANAIHNWFVENVQNGKDDHREYYVTREQLKKLLHTVTKVLENSELVSGKVSNGYQMVKNNNGELVEKYTYEDGKVIKDPSKAKELLPTNRGFFFGSIEYDQYYIQDLKETKTILLEALSSDDDADFYYKASW